MVRGARIMHETFFLLFPTRHAVQATAVQQWSCYASFSATLMVINDNNSILRVLITTSAGCRTQDGSCL